MFKFNNLRNYFSLLHPKKWVFRKPNKNKILIYDVQSLSYLNFILKNKKYEIFFCRYENINLYVLLITFFKERDIIKANIGIKIIFILDHDLKFLIKST